MAYTLSTNTLSSILENTSFTTTVTISKDVLDPAISSISINPIGEINGNIVITTGATSFTISGQYSNNFEQSITYLDSRSTENTINSKFAFTKLGDGFLTVVEYLASGQTSIIVQYAVIVNGGNIGLVSQQVNNNYTLGQDSLIAAVAKGVI